MFGGGRRITRHGGTRGQYQATLDTGGGIITALQGNNHQAMCLLVSCPRHHATCRLQTHCMDLCTLQIYICVQVLRIIKDYLILRLHICYYEFSLTRLVTRGTCHVSRFSPESRDNVSHVMSWAGAGHRSAFVRCLHYTLSLFVRNIEHNPHATSNGLKVDIFRKIVNYF